jgi:hypothetical protein
MKNDERNGATRIVDERKRQIEKEGWTPEHDDQHGESELALAAVCYAAPEPLYVHRSFNVNGSDHHFVDPWPEEWGDIWDKRPAKKPTDAQRIRMLEKAGALIAAEIDRLLRKKS